MSAECLTFEKDHLTTLYCISGNFCVCLSSCPCKNHAENDLPKVTKSFLMVTNILLLLCISKKYNQQFRQILVAKETDTP